VATVPRASAGGVGWGVGVPGPAVATAAGLDGPGLALGLDGGRAVEQAARRIAAMTGTAARFMAFGRPAGWTGFAPLPLA
jgi:hypothetical protein